MKLVRIPNPLPVTVELSRDDLILLHRTFGFSPSAPFEINAKVPKDTAYDLFVVVRDILARTGGLPAYEP